jgi:hypothetical protein
MLLFCNFEQFTVSLSQVYKTIILSTFVLRSFLCDGHRAGEVMILRTVEMRVAEVAAASVACTSASAEC